MAQKSATCGNATVHYDDDCVYVCVCLKLQCAYTVSCPKPGGGTYDTKGTGRTKHDEGEGPSKPKLTIDGPIEGAVFALEKMWKRKITLPQAMRGKKLQRRTVTGSREEMLRALGLKFRP